VPACAWDVRYRRRSDLDWGIGKDNGLPWPKLRGDLRHFKKTTSTASAGKRNAIVMGRKTWGSKEVGCSPLPNRLNVVVRHNALERLVRALRLTVG
jgi:dihydrofolate reductase